jgi:transposase-like protein
MTFYELTKKYPNEKAVIDHFINLRYNNGLSLGCVHCGSTHVYHRNDLPKVIQCMDCNNTFSVLKGTIFENSSTDMVKWMYAIHLFLNPRLRNRKS